MKKHIKMILAGIMAAAVMFGSSIGEFAGVQPLVVSAVEVDEWGLPIVAAPTEIKASKTSKSITLYWNDTGADMYRVYIYNETTKKYKKYRDVGETSCTIMNLEPNTKYKFKISTYWKNTKYETTKAITVTTKKAGNFSLKEAVRDKARYINQEHAGIEGDIYAVYKGKSLDYNGDGHKDNIVKLQSAYDDMVVIFDGVTNGIIYETPVGSRVESVDKIGVYKNNSGKYILELHGDFCSAETDFCSTPYIKLQKGNDTVAAYSNKDTGKFYRFESYKGGKFQYIENDNAEEKYLAERENYLKGYTFMGETTFVEWKGMGDL